MKHLDIVVSPPAFIWDPNLTSTHLTFDLDLCELDKRTSVSVCKQTDRQTAMHKSPPSISTGGLKNA